MAEQAAGAPEQPSFGLSDRLKKSRHWCGITSASVMAERLSERLGKPIRSSTVSSWEAGTQPTKLVRLEELVDAWVAICNEAGATIGRGTSAAFVYGTSSLNWKKMSGPDLRLLPTLAGPGQLELPLGQHLRLVPPAH